jgi:hypothetical protein
MMSRCRLAERLEFRESRERSLGGLAGQKGFEPLSPALETGALPVELLTCGESTLVAADSLFLPGGGWWSRTTVYGFANRRLTTWLSRLYVPVRLKGAVSSRRGTDS